MGNDQEETSRCRDILFTFNDGSLSRLKPFISSTFAVIDPSHVHVQAILLTPSRLSARQLLCHFQDESLGLTMQLCVGGSSSTRHPHGVSPMNLPHGKVELDRRKVLQGSHVIIGTPRRVFTLIRQGLVSLDHLKVFVVHEIDEIVRQGEKNRIETLLESLPSFCQLILMGHSLKDDTLKSFQRFLYHPVMIIENTSSLSHGSPHHHFFMDVVNVLAKFPMLLSILHKDFLRGRIVVMCNHRTSVSTLCANLKEQGVDYRTFSGETSPKERADLFRFLEKRTSRQSPLKADLIVTTRSAGNFLSRTFPLDCILHYDTPSHFSGYQKALAPLVVTFKVRQEVCDRMSLVQEDYGQLPLEAVERMYLKEGPPLWVECKA